MLNVLAPNTSALALFFKTHIKNLAVLFDNRLNFEKQISSIVRASFFQLRLLAKVKPFHSCHYIEKAIHASISSRLDYCKALYVGLTKSSISRLQLAAAQFLTGTSRREHLTSGIVTPLASTSFEN